MQQQDSRAGAIEDGSDEDSEEVEESGLFTTCYSGHRNQSGPKEVQPPCCKPAPVLTHSAH